MPTLDDAIHEINRIAADRDRLQRDVDRLTRERDECLRQAQAEKARIAALEGYAKSVAEHFERSGIVGPLWMRATELLAGRDRDAEGPDARDEREIALKVAEVIYVALHRDFPPPGFLMSADRDAKRLMTAAHAAILTYEAEKGIEGRRKTMIDPDRKA